MSKNKNNRALKKHLKYIVPEIRLALIKESGAKWKTVSCLDDMDKLVEPLKYYSEENFVSFHLDTKQQVIGYHIVSRGTVSNTIVHPREVFKSALLANSYAIIVAHNHPTGSLTPSKEDLEVTKALIKAGELMCIKLVDHIIVSSNGIRSLRKTHDYLWDLSPLK